MSRSIDPSTFPLIAHSPAVVYGRSRVPHQRHIKQTSGDLAELMPFSLADMPDSSTAAGAQLVGTNVGAGLSLLSHTDPARGCLCRRLSQRPNRNLEDRVAPAGPEYGRRFSTVSGQRASRLHRNGMLDMVSGCLKSILKWCKFIELAVLVLRHLRARIGCQGVVTLLHAGVDRKGVQRTTNLLNLPSSVALMVLWSLRRRRRERKLSKLSAYEPAVHTGRPRNVLWQVVDVCHGPHIAHLLQTTLRVAGGFASFRSRTNMLPLHGGCKTSCASDCCGIWS